MVTTKRSKSGSRSRIRIAHGIRCAGLCLIAAWGLGLGGARSEVSEIRVTRQPSLVYLPLVVMEQLKLFEKQAEARGLTGSKATWLTFTSGGASTDALLSGNVDLVTSGASNLLLLWEKTRGEVKGVAGASAIPMILVTRNPAVKTIRDFTERDRIAVPTLKVSMQATVLHLAAEQAFGMEGRDKLDSITVQLGHPDATAAILSPSHEVNSHFSLPPYVNTALADPKIHKVLDSADVVGGPLSNGVVFGTRRFHDANPKTMAAFIAGLEEAIALIKNESQAKRPNSTSPTPRRRTQVELTPGDDHRSGRRLLRPHRYNTGKVADVFVRSGIMKQTPKSWRDYFFSDVHGLPGS